MGLSRALLSLGLLAMLRLLLLAVTIAPACSAASLAVSTYFRDGFTPTAIASDASGNVYICGSVKDAASPSGTAAVAKLDPQASQYVYLTYLDGAASDQVSGIVVDGQGNAYITGWTTNPNFPVLGGGQLATPPTGSQDKRSFVIKLSP